MVRRGLTGGIFRLLSRSEIEAIHSASLQILQHVGLSVKSQKIFNVFKSGGTEIDEKKNLVRIPEHLVKECLNKAPHNVLLGGRNEENDIMLEDGRVHFGLGGSPNPYTLDVETGDFRVSTSEDVVRTTRLGDALPNISFVMSLGGAFDVPYETEWLHEASLMLRNTQKPIAYIAAGSEGAKYLLELAAAVRGGFEQLERRPPVLLFAEPLTPLVIPEINEAIIEFAKVKSPVAYVPGALPGASTPITLAGEHALCNAEILAGVVLTQLVRAGSPIVYGNNMSVIDMRTGNVCYGAPEWAMGKMMVGQLGEFYGLPTWGSGAGTDSKMPDAQAGAEAMMNICLSAAAGVNLVQNCGTVAHGASGSLEMGVICDEIINYVKRILTDVEVNDESLAVDLTRKVGPGGNFMAEKHTRTYLERGAILHPKLFNRQTISDWKARGQKSAREEAKEKVRQILKEHQVPALSKETTDQMDQILNRASQTMIKK